MKSLTGMLITVFAVFIGLWTLFGPKGFPILIVIIALLLFGGAKAKN